MFTGHIKLIAATIYCMHPQIAISGFSGLDIRKINRFRRSSS
nr:MAG TPA: hypothetical protein [Caudoviricetes sp.]